MSRFFPMIFLWTRSTTGMFSYIWSDEKGENLKCRASIWPLSTVLHVISNDETRSTTGRRRIAVSPHRASFRDYAIGQYENRLRLYSHPMKIFRYFATIKMKNKSGKWELYMTPNDFLRSIQPGARQPDRLGLDKYQIFDENVAKSWRPNVRKDSIFLKMTKSGLLTYSDYVFLNILISIPERNIRIGFKLFDLNGDGNVTIEELEQFLLAITRGEASIRASHLKNILFGSRAERTLSINDFLEFLNQLHTEIHTQQFRNLLKNSKSVISELDFAKVVLGFSYSHRRRRETLKRVKEKFGQTKRGINLNEFLAFFRFVQDVSIMDNELAFYYLTGADISPKTLQHISRVVSGVELSEHLTDVIFSIFDRDCDNKIQRKDFTTMRQQWMHPVPLRKNLRFTSTICILCKCSLRFLPSWMYKRPSTEYRPLW